MSMRRCQSAADEARWKHHEWSMHVHRIADGTFRPEDVVGAFLTREQKADLLERYEASVLAAPIPVLVPPVNLCARLEESLDANF